MFQMIDEPAYDFFRTKEQIGYLAYSRRWIFRDVIGGGFVIQSSNKSPEYMLSKILEFLDKLSRLDNDISEVLSDDDY